MNINQNTNTIATTQFLQHVQALHEAITNSNSEAWLTYTLNLIGAANENIGKTIVIEHPLHLFRFEINVALYTLSLPRLCDDSKVEIIKALKPKLTPKAQCMLSANAVRMYIDGRLSLDLLNGISSVLGELFIVAACDMYGYDMLSLDLLRSIVPNTTINVDASRAPEQQGEPNPYRS